MIIRVMETDHKTTDRRYDSTENGTGEFSEGLQEEEAFFLQKSKDNVVVRRSSFACRNFLCCVLPLSQIIISKKCERRNCRAVQRSN